MVVDVIVIEVMVMKAMILEVTMVDGGGDNREDGSG
jgi:hypothetical protein